MSVRPVQLDHRRLARAVRAQESEDGPLGHLEVDVVDGRQLPVHLRQVFRYDGISGHGAPSYYFERIRSAFSRISITTRRSSFACFGVTSFMFVRRSLPVARNSRKSAARSGPTADSKARKRSSISVRRLRKYAFPSRVIRYVFRRYSPLTGRDPLRRRALNAG